MAAEEKVRKVCLTGQLTGAGDFTYSWREQFDLVKDGF